MEKKWPPPRGAAQPAKPTTTPARQFKPAVAQAKPAAAAQPRPAPRVNTPSAPPVYRPEVKTAAAQAKAAAPPQTRARTPAYRPGGAPMAVQAKTASRPAHAVRPGAEVKRPAAPPVYNPQTTPTALQAKTFGPRRPEQNGAAPSAPPAFRPQPLPKCLQMKSAAGRPHRVPQSGSASAPPAYKPPPPPPARGVQMKQVRSAYGPLHGVVQRVTIYSKDADGGVGGVVDLANTKTAVRDYVKAASDLAKVSKDFATSLEYCEDKTERALIKFGIELVTKKLAALGGGGGGGGGGGAAPPTDKKEASTGGGGGSASSADLSLYEIGGMSLQSSATLLAEWAGSHSKSKGTLKAQVDDALSDVKRVVAAPKTFDKGFHDKVAAVIVKVNQAKGVVGASTVTVEEKKKAKKKKAKAKAKAAITPEQQFAAYADKIIGDIETVKLTGNRGLDLSEPKGTSANADALAAALRTKYQDTKATWAPGADVRYFIVRGAGTKIDITGHKWKDGKDVDYGTGSNVFNYHLNW